MFEDLSTRRIVVTGGAGFLGRAVVSRLTAGGCDQVMVPRSADYDLRTEDGVRRMYSDFSPQLVIHLAAVVGGIGANRASPGEFFYANAVMGLQLIEFGRRAGLEKLLCAGTVCAYPKFTPVPFSEDRLWDGYPEETNAGYGVAKKALLVQLQTYRQQYGFNGIYVIPVNLYGPGDNFDLETSHVIPAMIRRFVEAKERGADRVTLWGDGTPTREFLFVDDAAEGIIQATRSYDGAEPVNLGSGIEISIGDLAGEIAELTGFKGRIEWDRSQPNGQPRRALDTSRAREWFGFEAETSLDAGLRETYDWYLGQRMRGTSDAAAAQRH